MDLVLVAAVAVSVWLTIVVIAIGMCRVASRTEAREEGNVAVRPGTDSALGRVRRSGRVEAVGGDELLLVPAAADRERAERRDPAAEHEPGDTGADHDLLLMLA